MVTKTRIIRIGNSRGVRIPKPLIDQAELGEEVELEAQEGQIIVRAARRPRQDWDARFQEMALRGDDHLLDPEAVRLTAWDDAEWQW